MENQNLTLLAQKISRSEATVELADYWKKRYELILSQNLFVLSEKTSQQILTDQIVDRPSTPFGDLVLLSHLDANNSLDNIRLQSTIETAVRLLDATLDILNFNPESGFIVNQYRKIGLGFLDIAQYLETHKKASELDTIDQLGNLISNSSYRASETLAEEKKPCFNWESISRHLRPKSFELWFRENNDQKINGLALSEQYDSETILATDYQIIPRRNSNLLLLPPDLEWQIWSDRDETSPKTEVLPFLEKTTTTEEIPSTQENLEDDISNPVIQLENTQDELQNFELNEPNLEQLEDSSKPFLDSINQAPIEENEQLSPNLIVDQNQSTIFLEMPEASNEIDMSIFETLPQETLAGHSLLSSDKNQNEAVLENQTPLKLEQMETPYLEVEEKPILEFSPEPGLEGVEDQDEPLVEPITPENTVPQPFFAVGELVKIVREGDQHQGKILQILEHLEPEKDEAIRYRLIGGSKDITNILWSQSDLELVDLDILLDEINLISDHDKSLENNRLENLEQQLSESETKISQLNQTIEDLNYEVNNLQQQVQVKPIIDQDITDTDSEKIISDYLLSDDFANLIDTRVNQKIQELNLIPKTNQTTRTQNQTISTLQLMRKYSNK